MKHIWSILCENSSVDAKSNLISLFGCIEQLNLRIDSSKALKENDMIISFKLQLISFWIVQNISKDNVLETKIELLDPDKKSLKSFKKSFNIKKGILRFRSRLNIDGLPITKEGRYIFRVSGKEADEKKYKLVAELPLDINIAYKLSGIR